jgi:hypothetical protein
MQCQPKDGRTSIPNGRTWSLSGIQEPEYTAAFILDVKYLV